MNKKILCGLGAIALAFLVVWCATAQSNRMVTDYVDDTTAGAQSTSTAPIAENPEGEADPNRMTLDMTPWKWIDARNADGKFVLTLGKDGRFSAKTDCNGVGGQYESSKADGTIFFSQMISTLMFCEGSHESEFTGMLSTAETYKFTSRGQLILTLKDGKTMTFN